MPTISTVTQGGAQRSEQKRSGKKERSAQAELPGRTRSVRKEGTSDRLAGKMASPAWLGLVRGNEAAGNSPPSPVGRRRFSRRPSEWWPAFASRPTFIATSDWKATPQQVRSHLAPKIGSQIGDVIEIAW